MSPKRMKPRELVNSIVAPTNIGRVPPGVFSKEAGKWWITTGNFIEKTCVGRKLKCSLGLQEESSRKSVCIRDQYVRELVWANETRD